jgi:hypothetical protein
MCSEVKEKRSLIGALITTSTFAEQFGRTINRRDWHQKASGQVERVHAQGKQLG